MHQLNLLSGTEVPLFLLVPTILITIASHHPPQVRFIIVEPAASDIAAAIPTDHDIPVMSNPSITSSRPTVLGLSPSFGFGDHIGLATAGHVEAMCAGRGIEPILAQQSIREMARTVAAQQCDG